MFAAVALAAYLVQPGDTLSGIAASHGASLAAVEAANPGLANPNLIFAGQTVRLPGGSSAAQAAPAAQGGAATQSQASTATQSSTATQGSTQASGTSSSYRSPSSIASTATQGSSAGSSGSGYSTSSLSDIPGVPQSFAACVAYRESTNLQNPAANGNAYGIIPASGYNVYGSSLSNQKQVFAKLYQQYGTSPWASDGC